MVSEKFGSESENKDLYREHLINLYTFIQAYATQRIDFKVTPTRK